MVQTRKASMRPRANASDKSAEIPRIKVQPTRKAGYEKAYKVELRNRPDLSFADFVREALDAHSEKILRREEARLAKD